MQSRGCGCPSSTGRCRRPRCSPAAVAEPGRTAAGPGDTHRGHRAGGRLVADELAPAGDRVSLGPHVLRVETAPWSPRP